jgi:hypothetical protein
MDFKKIIIGIIPVIIGGIIYTIFRNENLVMFKWYKKIGIYDKIKKIRNIEEIKNIKIPEWIIYCLPDALWLLSMNYIILIFWKFRINKNSIIWITITTTIGLYSEIGQYLKVIPGTFDIKDLLILMIASIIPMIFIKDLKTKKYEIN